MATTSANKPSHLKALLRKNWILWKRSWCVSLCEFLIPFIFALMIIAFKQASTTEDIPTVTYYNKPSTSYLYDGTLNTAYFKDCLADENGGKVAIVPKPTTNTFANKIDLALRAAGFDPKGFDSSAAIDDYTTQTNYASLSATQDTLCFGVVINKDGSDGKYEYALRFNVSGFDNPDLPDTSNQRVDVVSFQEIDSMYDYGHSGFLQLQNYIDNIILQDETVNTANIQTRVTSRTVEGYTDDGFASNMKGQIALFVALPLLLPYLRFMNGILTEKEKKIREGMKIMGLRNSAFYSAWFITYFIIFTIASVLVSIALKAVLANASWILIFLWHWEFSMTLMAMGYLITTFFSKAKVGNVAGFVVALFLGFLQSVATSDSSSGVFFGISFAPQTSLGLAVDHMLDLETAQVGLTSDTINLKVNNYQMSYHYIVMLIDFIIFILLGTYFDKVLPSEFGIRKHPLFCLMRNKKTDSNQLRRVDSIDRYQQKQESGHFEEAANTLKAQDEKGESIKVQSLRKVYDTGKVAVDNVSFNMYQGQIFALLGHNGAGKTTTISMMTGLFDSTAGSTKVFGLDIQEDLEEIRKTMGICPQHDILFDNLTVKEHLEMYSVFKGVEASRIPEEVEKTIHDIGLGEKRDYLSKNLSGGQKRKLSIGMAFIGGSKFILLDEPSSGMDTSARRKLWDMLKNYKHDRVVLLTTHFMDEADYLGDRIGIMAEGQLKCLGSPLFLKSKFGIGYNLTMVKKDINVPSQPIKELVQKHIPESNILSDVSAEFALQLPLEAASKFQNLFDELDKNLNKLGISTYGVSVTTLEEVFLNVAKINAPEKHYKAKDDTALAMKDDLDDYNIEDDRIKGSWMIFKTHFVALVKKRIQYTKRDKRGLICELLLPILMVIGGIIIANSAFDNDVKVIVIEDSMYDYTYQMDYNRIVPATSAAIDPDFLKYMRAPNIIQKGVAANNLADFDERVLKDQGPILESPVNVFSVLMNDYNAGSNTYDYTVFLDTRAREGSVYAMNKVNNAILKAATSASKSITVINSPFLKTAGAKSIDQVFSGLIYAFVLAIAMSLLPASLITYIVKEREFNAKHQQIVSGVSITAYWFSNFFVDIIKYMIPAVINALLAMALNATALIDGDKLGAMWLDFILYGFAIIPFVYLTAFLFRNYGTAQIASFFFNFCTGFILGLAASIFKIFDSTRTIGEALQWIFRPLPSFSMTFGFINLANRDVYTMSYDRTTQMSAYDLNLTGGDLLIMGISAIVYTALIFVVESLKNKQGINSALSRETKVQYVPKKLDDDVEREQREVEASDNDTYSIKVDKLRKVYPIGKGQYKVAVDQLSFGVKNGECFALLGVNGAGKTTTFKILSGDYTQTSGRAHINGFEIPQRIAEAQRNIGYCPQFDSILELLTAKEHLHLYAAIKGIPENLRGRMVEKQLVEMNLKQYENIPAGTYSGGNKRKLSVAIAMIGNPAVVFLDEPSTGMDPEARRFMWNVISRISRERKQSSIILTTHSMEEAEALATKMGIMVNGNLKCLGTSQHIKNKFGGGYEIEVKLELPAKHEVDGIIKQLPPQMKEALDNTQINAVLQSLHADHLKKEIKEDGAGSSIFSELKKGKVSTQLLVEWILIEKCGDNLKEFFKESFGEVSIIEHFQSFYRFKASNSVTVGNFFGLLEKNKTVLNVQQYSIKQGSIEQIFNTFAAQEFASGRAKED